MSNYKRMYLQGYDYVFFTIVTNNRENILIENIDLLRESFKNALENFEFNIIAICVMQNHLHMILKLKNIKEYPKIIYSIKFYFSHRLNKNNKISESKVKKGEKGIWQRRYWEHTIRDEKDLYTHLDYIHYNSMKHYQISPRNWKYSTFLKFVEKGYYDINWCNFDDVNNINDLNLE